MAEQLHCSEIHSKNIENMLSKLYISTYSIVEDVRNKAHAKTTSVCSKYLTAGALLIMSRV